MSKGMILSCPAVGGQRIAQIKNNISSWLTQNALEDLVAAFHGSLPRGLDLNALAKWYLEFSECWDFRGRQKQAFDKKVGEGARWLLSSDDLSETQKESALTAAWKLGFMNNDEPMEHAYDYLWVLGGARLSCLLRSRLARHAIRSGAGVPKAVVFLTSMRPIGDAEREATDTYAPNAETEFDLSVAAAQKEFGVADRFSEERYDDEANANNSWVVRRYETTDYEILLVAAPSSDPQKRRANSSDTYEFFRKKFRVPEHTSILLTTSQIYVPYQHLEAVRTIAVPYGINLDTIGFPAQWGGVLQGMNEPSNYLQEIRSTIQSIGRFFSEHS
ncbi:MAG: hypothetical protein LBQ15_12035 [Clostridium sp.]|jgi:hypothetical protein|nr:hypothetical protein [Clostridium sp.]